tara:strand:+ start:3767 stop:4387 length:621 start_codon:yes stop_codon:yes gene_type:complete
MITRRSFLIGASGLLTYSLLDKYLSYYENHGEALIEYPKDYDNILFLDPDAHWFELGNWEDLSIPEYPVPPTWAEFINKYTHEYVDLNSPQQIERLYLQYGILLCDYSKPCDKHKWEAHYSEIYNYRKNTPPCFAYEYLSRLNLGTELTANDASEHELWFCEADGTHDDVKSVTPRSAVSLSLLQKKLVELGEPTRVVGHYSDPFL